MTANPWRRRLPSATAASGLTEGRIASTVASRGSRLAVSAINWSRVSPSVNSTRARDSRMRINCSAPRRVSTTTGSRRSLAERISATRRAAWRERMS